jgi:hypothetical protein
MVIDEAFVEAQFGCLKNKWSSGCGAKLTLAVKNKWSSRWVREWFYCKVSLL